MDDTLHATRVSHTLEELQQKVNEHEDILLRLRASSAASRPSQNLPPTASLEVMERAYNDLAATTPFLPYSDSTLPALLALRRTHQTVQDTRAFLNDHQDAVAKAKRQLEVEQGALRDQQAISKSLQDRIQSMEETAENRMQMDPEDIVRERVEHLVKRNRHYERDTSRLLKVLRKFIEENLGGMLAAEDLGGPVVGDIMEIDGDDLAAGFNAQGRQKKAKPNPDQDKRQRRIDEIWGKAQEGEDEDGADASRDEAAAAAAEMRQLTEELLNNMAQADGDTSAAYVQLPRETAAARFLVRSKVAQFHPRDATKLRLIDFGREIDD